MIRVHTEAEKITHGQRFLLKLLERRKFAAWCERQGLPLIYMHRVAAGINKMPCAWIYRVREEIGPSEWFYYESEELPVVRYYASTERERWEWKESLGMQKLREYTGGGVSTWCKENNLRYSPVYTLLHADYPPGIVKLRSLREQIEPGSWFFYEQGKG